MSGSRSIIVFSTSLDKSALAESLVSAAFNESMFQEIGLVCLLQPPFTFYYSTVYPKSIIYFIPKIFNFNISKSLINSF